MSQAGIISVNNIPPPPGSVLDLKGNDGISVGPDGSGVINVLGETLYTTRGNAGSHTLFIDPRVNAYPITPFVVGPVGSAGYQTIQAGINAANAAGGGLIFIQSGTYTENLTLYTNLTLMGDSEQSTFIVGTHTPPSSGTLNLFRIGFSGTNAILSSSAAGTTAIIMEDCSVNVTNGWTFDLLNWVSPGSVAVDDIGPFGTNDGFFRNTGGAGFYSFFAGIGNGTANSLTISGSSIINGGNVGCPISLQTGSSFTFDSSFYSQTITLSNNSTGSITNCRLGPETGAALTMSSSGSLKISSTIIDSSNNPAISGAGVGTLTYSDLVFLNNASFAGTLTLATVSWQPYSRAIAASDGTKVGTSAFNSSQFTVDTSGFVSLKSPLFTWIDIGISSTLASNTGYFVTAASTQTLPAVPAQGYTVKIVCDTASAVVVTASPGQTIRLSASASSVAGTFTNTARGDSLELFYRAATSQWIALNAVGNWTVA